MSNTSKCDHDPVTISERAFSGPVGRDEDRRAHGNVTVEVECRGCGARRKENRNQGHVELGTWGPTRAQRHARAQRNLARLERLTVDGVAEPVSFRALGSDRVEVTIGGVARVYEPREMVPAADSGDVVIRAWQQMRARANEILAARLDVELERA